MNYVKILIIACEFMAARIILVLLCTTSVIFELVGADLKSELDAYLETNYSIQFTSEPEDIVVASGQSAVFNCAVKTNYSDLNYTISWIFTKDTISFVPIKAIQKGHSYVHANGSLIIEKVRPVKLGGSEEKKSDEGIYRCKVETALGTLISQAAYLKIAEISAEHPEYEQKANIGDTARLICGLRSEPQAIIKWQFKDKELPSESKKYVTALPEVLYIHDVRESDAGEYRCVGTNTMSNQVVYTTTTLEVTKKPINLKPKSSDPKIEFLSPYLEDNEIWVREHDKFVMECFVGDSEVIVGWKKELVGASSTNTSYDVAYNTLIIPKVSQDDRGTYTCLAYKKSSSQTKSLSFVLEVGTRPRIEIPPKSVKYTMLSVSKRFECKTKGYPRPQMKWMINGTEIDPRDSRLKVLENDDLMIDSLDVEDTGFYQCFAVNRFGTASSAALLAFDVKEIPSPVTGLRCATVNSTAILVSFDHPQDDLAPPIPVKSSEFVLDSESTFEDHSTSSQSLRRVYVFNYYPTDRPHERKDEAIFEEMHIVDKLQPNTNYSFYVSAYYGRTGSPRSKIVRCVTKSEGVLRWSHKVIFPDTLYLQWPGADVDNEDYEIRYRPADESSDEIITRTNSRSMIVTGLTPNVTYEFKISPVLDDRSVRSPYEIAHLRLPSWLTTTNKIRWHQINASSILVTWNLCQKKKGWAECKEPGDLLQGFQLVYHELDDETDIKIVEAKKRYPFVVIHDLKPETKYQLSLFITVRDVKAKVETQIFQINPAALKPKLASPVDVVVKSASTFTKVLWTYISLDISRPLYVITYRKTTSQNVDVFVSKAQYADLYQLKPNTEYELRVRVYDDQNECSPQTDINKFRTPMIAPEMITNLTCTPINSSSVVISWNKPEASESTNLILILDYYSDESNVTQIQIPGNESSILITELSPSVQYLVSIRARNIIGDGKKSDVKSFMLVSENSQNDYLLRNEQLIGVLIGCAISVFIIALCLATILCCKRRLEKHYRERSVNVRILTDRERYEMRNLHRNPANGYRGTYVNGSGTNLQLPLLSNGIYANGYGPSAAQNARYSTQNGRLIRDEANTLLNPESPLDETCQTIVEMNDHDHEGGDSGYGDRDHSQSPQLNDHAARSRHKCSDIAVDGGFFENDPSPM